MPAPSAPKPPAPAPRRSGRRIVLVGLPLALLGGVLIIVLFAKYGRGNFTRAARIVETRARSFELAKGIERCVGGAARRPLPPTAAAAPGHLGWFDEAASAKAFAAEAFACAAFRPKGEVHVRVQWRRTSDVEGVSVAELDDDGDGVVEFAAETTVRCAAGVCLAGEVVERSAFGGEGAR